MNKIEIKDLYLVFGPEKQKAFHLPFSGKPVFWMRSMAWASPTPCKRQGVFSKTYTLSFSSSDQTTFSKPISTSIFAVISAYTLLYWAFVNIGNSSKKNKRHSLRSKMARIEDFLFISLEFDSKLSLVYCFSYSYPST